MIEAKESDREAVRVYKRGHRAGKRHVAREIVKRLRAGEADILNERFIADWIESEYPVPSLRRDNYE